MPGARVSRGGISRRPGKELTTICPLVTAAERLRATAWTRHALAQGQYRFHEGDKTYPKHIWHQYDDGQFWFGFCVNSVAGSYKGWPIEEVEKRATFG